MLRDFSLIVLGLLPKWNVLLLSTNSRDGGENGERRDFTALGTQGNCWRTEAPLNDINIWIMDEETQISGFWTKKISLKFCPAPLSAELCCRKFLQESRTLPWNTKFEILMKAQESFS